MAADSHEPLVLFLCTGNSARSIMAEAILRARAVDRVEVASAGLEPRGVHPMSLQVLSEAGIDTRGLHSKSSTDFLGKVAVRWAIILCESANRSCPHIYPFATHTLYWPFDDPAAPGLPEPQRLARFREVRDRITARIDAWLVEVGDPAGVVVS